ncbi:MAG: cytochrome c3 family protein [bacterium]
MNGTEKKSPASPLAKIVAALLLVGLVLVAGWLIQTAKSVGVNQGYEPDQPIAYSHKIHVGDNKIDCLYCHFGAEQSRHAGIPPANVCLNCHNQIKKDSPEIQKIFQAIKEGKPIPWVKVHNLPDFVYFNHSQHVTAGVDCRSCHGPVESMGRMRQDQTLSMGWCIQCHRARGITPPPGHAAELGQEPLQGKELLFKGPKGQKTTIGGMDCAKCHY